MHVSFSQKASITAIAGGPNNGSFIFSDQILRTKGVK